jgi:DNA topoisomerase I
LAEPDLTAYCVKCRVKRVLQNAQACFTERGQAGTRGVCPTCGTTLFRMGRTPAHEALPQPEIKHKAAVSPKDKAAAPAKGKVPHPARGKGSAAGKSATGKPSFVPKGHIGALVIVESPAKARTIGKFLGSAYTVRASVGHVRDLLRSRLSVDVEHDFLPEYRVPNERKQVVKELTGLVQCADRVYLATDPDREGEAIAWHLVEATGARPEQTQRVVFHEITKPAIAEAFAHPRGIDMELVDAQQARRILDRLVGYSISPLLWTRVRSRLSAGRVQSVAVRLVVDREREIRAFVPVEYWSITAELAKRPRVPERPTFMARLARIDGKEVDLKDQPAAQAVVDDLDGATYAVSKVQRGERQRRPSPPFTTSTLQQEASRRLGYSAKRTMAVAQQLYEGIDIGAEGTVGLITYMRTDSVQVSTEAQAEARAFVEQRWGKEYLPAQPPVYKTKTRGAQEAHEAIRPTAVRRAPQTLQPYLERDQFRLYDLIWRRFLASQMANAVYDTLTVEVKAGRPAPALVKADAMPEVEMAPWRYLFRASGSTVRFPGFLALYEEARDEAAGDEEANMPIPLLTVGEVVDLLRLLPEQHFTQPPPRYTEASLVKALEELGIGRPSTYAAIMSTIQARGYVDKQNRYLIPTDIGFTVNDLLVQHFPEVVDTGFTAHMEEDLDRIAEGEANWVQVLREFYGPFAVSVKRAEAEMPKVQAEPEATGEMCDKCGAPMVVKFGRFGKFISCSNYPQCKNAKPWLEKIGVACPECRGELVERRTKTRRTFWGCARYPECQFSTWKRPVAQPCPSCGGLLTAARKGWLQCLRCQQEVPARENELSVPASESGE